MSEHIINSIIIKQNRERYWAQLKQCLIMYNADNAIYLEHFCYKSKKKKTTLKCQAKSRAMKSSQTD